ncbi:MAG: ligase-associated DNA damage response endonuclease PdeM [Luteolibacter sp.]
MVTLLAGRAVFLDATRTLVVSDIHLGKSATFRTRGIPVPEGDTFADLAALSDLVGQTDARHLVIAGDLVHAKAGMRPNVLEAFREWAAGLSIPITLTEGNHDRMALLFEHDLPLEIVPSLDVEGLRITHDPEELPEDVPGIAGHLHPGAKVVDSPRRTVRVPAFYLLHPHHLVLPAFSQFTGMNRIKPGARDRFFIPLKDRVMPLPASAG